MKKSNDCNMGCIKKVSDPNNFSDLIDMYVAGSTINGYCYKDYDTFYKKLDEVCYIADETLYKDYVNDNIILKKTAELASGTCKKFEGCYGMNAKAIEALDNIIK